jgi:hypothetical protein
MTAVLEFSPSPRLQRTRWSVGVVIFNDYDLEKIQDFSITPVPRYSNTSNN